MQKKSTFMWMYDEKCKLKRSLIIVNRGIIKAGGIPCLRTGSFHDFVNLFEDRSRGWVYDSYLPEPVAALVLPLTFNIHK